MSDISKIFEIDMRTDRLKNNSFKSTFQITVQADCCARGMVGWFDCELAEGIHLRTSPLDPPTHWKQTLFYFKKPLELPKDHKM